jgi:hypothetical protein
LRQAAYASDQFTEEQRQAFRSIKVVRLVVKQSYGTAKGVNLPFEKVARQFLQRAGLQVAGLNAQNFVDLIEHPVERVRIYAAMALSSIPDLITAKPLIVAAMQNESAEIRGVAEMNLLGRTKVPVVIEVMIDCLKHKNPDVRTKAAGLLKKGTGQNFGESHPKWKRWWGKNKTEFLKNKI